MKKMKSLRVILKTSLLACMMLIVSCQQNGILHENPMPTLSSETM